jgi:hypothetical protein
VPTCQPTYLPTYLLANLPTYLTTYLPTCRPTYLSTYLYIPASYLPTYIPTDLPTYPPTCRPTYPHTDLLPHLHTSTPPCEMQIRMWQLTQNIYLCTYLRLPLLTPAHLHACLPATHLHIHLPAYLHTYLLADLHVSTVHYLDSGVRIKM